MYFSAPAIAFVVVLLQATTRMIKLILCSSECQSKVKKTIEQEQPNDIWAHMKINGTWWHSTLSTFGQHSHIFRGGAQPGFGGGRKWLRPSSMAGAMTSFLSFTFTFEKNRNTCLKQNWNPKLEWGESAMHCTLYTHYLRKSYVEWNCMSTQTFV